MMQDLSTILAVLDGLMTQEQANQSFLTHVEYLLVQPISQAPTMPDIALALGMSERTLRRSRFSDAGTSYSELLDRVRQARALEMLRLTQLPLASIAVELGFEDVRSLRRKVLLWTGQSAKELRQGLKP